MRKLVLFLVFIAVVSTFSLSQSSSEAAIRSIVTEFQHALEKRDISAIEPLVAQDLVVLENGHRNDGWLDFRDNHLIPELKEPAPPSKTELIKITGTPTMGWAYTRTVMSVTRKNGEKADVELWTVFIVQKRGAEWKIVLLDWSLHVQKVPAAK